MSAGCAIGLGNVWRFPYLAAKYGGGIFLLIYIILAVTFGYALIVSETALGRMTRKSPVGAFGAFGKGKSFKFGGWINAVVPILIVPYYSVIGGWVLKYLFEYLRGNVSVVAEDGYFSAFIASSGNVEFWFLLFCALVFIIILAGVKNGVERVSKVMMPMLVILAIFVAIYSVTRPGAFEGVKYFADDHRYGHGTDVLFAFDSDGHTLHIRFVHGQGRGHRKEHQAGRGIRHGHCAAVGPDDYTGGVCFLGR